MKTENRLSIGNINGVEIYAVKDEEGKVLVPVKPICDAIGVSFEGQYEKLKVHHILSSTVRLSLTVGADGKAREMVCLPQEFIYGWIFTINKTKIKLNPKLWTSNQPSCA